MREKGIPDTIDRSLSIREATVFVNEETDTVTVSFKGTNFMNVQDVAADVALYDNKALKLGVGALSPKIGLPLAAVEAVGQGELKEVRDLMQVYNKIQGQKDNSNWTFFGWSKSPLLGKHIGIETVAFNPGPLGSNGKPCEQCTVCAN